MEEAKFISSIKKVSGPRVHKVTNSYGVYDYFSRFFGVSPGFFAFSG